MSGYIGAGSAGTCFSGGAGSGGTYGIQDPVTSGTADAGINGGFGTDGVDYSGLDVQSMTGAGNPTADSREDPDHAGTGGVLIIFVEGTITREVIEGGDPSTTKYFTANGVEGAQCFTNSTYDTSCLPFGGGTGGGIVIVVNNNASNLLGNVEANGGIIERDGPGGAGNFQSGGNGAAVAYTFSEL
jgi:hypothetical protein